MEETGDQTGMLPVSEDCHQQCEWIRKNMPAHCSISARYCSNGHADVVALCQAILENPEVTHITFAHPNLVGKSLAAVEACLSRIERLETVGVLYGSSANSLLPCIATNKVIRRLWMNDCVAEAGALANMIRTTTVLERLEIQTGHLSFRQYPAYSADEIASVAAACLHNQSIHELCLRGLRTTPLASALVSNLGQKLTALELECSSDGTAVASLLRNSQRLRTLKCDGLTLTREDGLAITEGLAQNLSLRELDLAGLRTHPGVDTQFLVRDMIRAASSLERICIKETPCSPQAWHSIFESLARLSNIRNISLRIANRYAYGPDVANLLERSSRLQHLDIGYLNVDLNWYLRGDGFEDLARGLAATTSLVELRVCLKGDTRPDMLRLLFDQGLLQCPILKRLHLCVGGGHPEANLLAGFVEKNRTLRSLNLQFDTDDEEGTRRDLSELVNAMALNDVLEEFTLDSAYFETDEELASRLSLALPKLWNLKTLCLEGLVLLGEAQSVMRQLDLNMSLTDFDVRTNYAGDARSKAIKKIVKRNQALHSSEYGQNAAPSLWPAMIHLALRNEHVGPSMVYRLLSMRSGVLASFVPNLNIRPSIDDTEGGPSERDVARRRMK